MLRNFFTLTCLISITCLLLAFAAQIMGRAFPGAMLAFVSQDTAGSPNLYVLDLPRTTRIALPYNDVYAALQSWNTEGTLAFMIFDMGEDSEVYAWYDNTLTRLSQDPTSDTSPRWSADGRLAIIIQYNEINAIYVWDGQTFANVVQSSDTFYSNLAWSPAGKLAFEAIRAGDSEIYLWDGLILSNISQSNASDFAPSWSADERLAFVSHRDDNLEIYLWDGLTLSNISQHPAQDYSPSWSADGRLVFASTRDGNNEIYEWNGISFNNLSRMPDTSEYAAALWTP
jgi:Tol biopolymer transport system component